MAELFEEFEVERVSRWPIMLRLVGGSVVLHLIMLAVAFYVPAVRDALNLASTFSDSSFVDKDYKKTNFEDRAQILNLPKFQYPEGYFQPASATPMPDPFGAQIVSTAPPVVMTPPVPPMMAKMPKVKGTPPPAPSPSPSPSVDPKDPNGQTVAASELPRTPAEADAEIAKVAQANNVSEVKDDEINKKPFKDWLTKANTLKTEGKLDLNKPLEITILAEFDENGKLVRQPLITQKSGDPVLIELARDMVGAIIDSNMLKFLKDPQTQRLETRELNIKITLDQQALTGKVLSGAASPERAQQLSSTYSKMLSLAKIARAGKDEEALIKNTKISYEGNQIIINFAMPRSEASDMVKKQLAQPAT
ncbi:MAG: hypothetical protein JO360_17085 [Acidobacteria bacterium]|nr:hypothetical protein [Acidobacteriota bacterium]